MRRAPRTRIQKTRFRVFYGVRGGSRTHGLSLRRRPLYPTELHKRIGWLGRNAQMQDYCNTFAHKCLPIYGKFFTGTVGRCIGECEKGGPFRVCRRGDRVWLFCVGRVDVL